MRLWLCLSSMNKICYIFGAGSCEGAYIKNPFIVIGADGGYEYLLKNGIKADIIVGDFDSLGYVPKGENVTVLPKEKDETDTAAAVRIGIEKGADTFVIYGGLGGRLDHTIANIQLICALNQKGYKAFLLGEGSVITLVTDSDIVFDSRLLGYVSVFAHSEICEGVTIKGLKYCLDNARLKNSQALGVSNEFIGKPACISVKSGTLTVMWQQTAQSFIENI